jgi:hypothetical protein
MSTYDIDKDYDLWLEEQVNYLRSRHFEKLDVNNLIQELEALVRGEKSAVENFAYQIMLYLLLIDYWHEESEWNRRHWRSEVDNFQFQINRKLTANLTKHLSDALPNIYAKAKKRAISKTGLKDRFPEQIPYSLDVILAL